MQRKPNPATGSPLCPSCERYMGPVTKCPYCNADSTPSPMVRLLRVTALLLSTVGLALLLIAAKQSTIPSVTIGEISPAMNFARVQVSGRVPQDAFTGKRGDYVSFIVEDSSGSIRAVAYRQVAERLIDEGRLPQSGDRVDVTGGLNVAPDAKPRLYIRDTRNLSVHGQTQEAAD